MEKMTSDLCRCLMVVTTDGRWVVLLIVETAGRIYRKHELALHKSCRWNRIISLWGWCRTSLHTLTDALLHTLRHTYTCDPRTKTKANMEVDLSSSVYQALKLLLAAFVLSLVCLSVASSLHCSTCLSLDWWLLRTAQRAQRLLGVGRGRHFHLDSNFTQQ